MYRFKTKPDYIKQYSDKDKKDLDKVSTYRTLKHLTRQGGEILEIGCGTGYLLHYLGDGIGIDIDSTLIDECRKHYKKSTFLVSGCYDIPLESERFDTVVMCMVVEHLDQPTRAISEAKRVLKEGGNFLIVVPNRKDWFYTYLVKKDPTHVREYDTQEITDLVSGQFSCIDVTYGTVSTKIPDWMTSFVTSDIIVNCKK